MKSRWLLLSLSSHLGLATFLCFRKPSKDTPKDKVVIVRTLPDKELRTARSAKVNKQKPNKNQKIYLGERTQEVEQNQQAKIQAGAPGFQEASKSISSKGKYQPSESKGKGISASDDYLDDAVIGPITIINTQEFKYFNYYDRIRQQVVENWRPLIKHAIIKVKRDEKTHGKLDIGLKITKLKIILNEKGEIKEINILSSSGYRIFDAKGKEAFLQCQRFASPPKDLVKNNEFILRWDFVVNVEPAGLVELKGGQVL